MPTSPDPRSERVQLGVRIAPELNKLVADRAKELGLSKADLVEKWLYFSANADMPGHPAIPQAYEKIMDNLADRIAAKIWNDRK